MNEAAEDIVNVSTVHILEHNSDAVFNEQGSSQHGGGGRDFVLSCSQQLTTHSNVIVSKRVMLCSGLLKQK